MSACPPDETWAAFPEAVHEAERDSLVHHLASCTACRTLVVELARQQGQRAASSEDGHDSMPAADAPRDRRALAARHGRFVVLDILGEGGMGTVLSAYDPRLERRVALKVLRGAASRSAAGDARLLREAQALARIAHPNVVPIHEVAELDGEVVLVMEHVAGQTLQAWVRAEARPWQAIVKAYVQAGRGLAAAHAAGLVHRDFKPSNALIGADDRVRVIDFGLVRWAERGELVSIDDSVGASQDADRLTRTGSVLGTPAYMAPEQFERADVGPRTDIYALCISLTEALYGVRAFDGRRGGYAPGEGLEPPSPAAVPKRVWTVLRRGLSTATGDRPSSIEVLLDDLDALIRPRRRRWVVAAMAGLGVTGVALATLAFTRNAVRELEPCSGGAAHLATIWHPGIAAEVERHLAATNAAYGEAVTPRIVGMLSSYARTWADGHRDACMSHRRGEQSAALLDRRMSCLDRQRQALAATIDILLHDDASGDPIRLVLGLPAASQCADLDRLSPRAPALDPATADHAHQLEGKLERAAALEHNGKYRDASEIAAGIVRAAAPLGVARLDASANLQLGRARLLAGELGDSVEPLQRAQSQAIVADAPEVAVEAIARRIYVEGVGGELAPSTLDELRSLAESLLERTHDGAFARALLLNNVGVVHRARGDRATAREVLQQALVARETVSRSDTELGVIVENLAAVTDDPSERQALFERAVREAEASLGPQHPETLRSRLVQIAGLSAPDERARQLGELCSSWEHFHPQMVTDHAICEQERGSAEEELGQHSAASTHYARAASLHAASGQTLRAELTRGHAEALAGHDEPARRSIEAALAKIAASTPRPWERALRAELLVVMAELALRARKHREAMRHADEAIAAIDGIDASGRVQWQVVAARARVAAARARLARGIDRARAAALIEEAEHWYRSVTTGYDARLRELELLLARARER